MGNEKKRCHGQPGIGERLFLRNIVHQRRQKRRLYAFLKRREFLDRTNISKGVDDGQAAPPPRE